MVALTMALAVGLACAGCGPGGGQIAASGGAGHGGGGATGRGGATAGGGPVADAAAGGSSATAADGASSPDAPSASGDRGPGSDGRGATDSSGSPDLARPDRVSTDGVASLPEAGSVAEPACKWPVPASDQKVAATIAVAKLFDGGMKRFVGDGPLGTSGQLENQSPLFQLANGATLQNVILGNPAADGVHCAGTCTLENVWWEDVGEDAATLKGSSASQVMTIDGGGARHATDKVFQHNGPGTMVIQNFCVEDFGKLYRSCGNCGTQYGRHAVIRNVSATLPGGVLAGVNTNYGDSATFSGIFVHGGSLTICERYTGNNTGAEPVTTGSGPDGKFCVYDPNKDVLLR